MKLQLSGLAIGRTFIGEFLPLWMQSDVKIASDIVVDLADECAALISTNTIRGFGSG